MALGPIEVLVVAFPENRRFSGEIMPELQRLIDAEIISVVDGLFVTKDADENVMFVEIDELDANADARFLSAVLTQVTPLISEDDVVHLADALDPNSSAAILVFEHTWAKGLRDAILNAGGELAVNFRVPGLVIEEMLAELLAEA